MPLIIGGVSAGIGLATKGYNLYQSGQEEEKARKELARLRNEPLPQETADPTLLSYYATNLRDSRNAQGISAAEKAAYNTDVSNKAGTQFYNATNTAGGNLSRYIRSALQPGIISSSNQLVGQDQRIKMQNRQAAAGRVGSAVSSIQGIRSRNEQNAIRRRMMIEQALGGAVAQNNRYQTETLDSIGGDLIGAGTMYGLNTARAAKAPAGNVGTSNPYTNTTGEGNWNFRDYDYDPDSRPSQPMDYRWRFKNQF